MVIEVLALDSFSCFFSFIAESSNPLSSTLLNVPPWISFT